MYLAVGREVLYQYSSDFSYLTPASVPDFW